MGLSSRFGKWLSKTFGNAVLFDEPMHRHTYFNIGGPADALVKPNSLEKLVELIHGCRDFQTVYWIMGSGSNLLIKDRGIRGVVIVLDAGLNRIEKQDSNEKEVRVNAMAGVNLQKFCRYAVENGFGGLDFALGIPGSVGGGIAMNAGTASGSMEDIVCYIRVLLPSGKIINVPKDQMAFSYRALAFQSPAVLKENKTPIILEGSFSLSIEDPDVLRAKADAVLHRRRETQPVNERSAGCFFKNPASGLPAGRLIEEAGMKGMSIGDAQVSTRHANFIINRGKATAWDVLELMVCIQENVNKKFNIFLEPEVKIVGE